MPQISLAPFEKIQTILDLEDSEEGLINLLSFSASTEIENHCQRILCKREIGEYNHGYKQNSLELREQPVEIITTLKIWRNNPLPAYIPMAEDSYHIEINPQGNATINLLSYYSFPRGTKNIKVTYTAGYSPETLPDDLFMALCESVNWMYKRLKARQIGVSQLLDERDSGSRFSYDKSLPEHVIQILKPYKRKGW